MSGLDEDRLLNLVYLVALLALLLGSFGFRRRRFGARLRHLATWALIGLALIVAYAYREPLMRFAAPVIAELDPSRVVEVTSADGTRELVVRRGDDGHFHVEGETNGATIRFLVDTGASLTVLTQRDAARSGVDVEGLRFTRPVQTANGRAFYAAARLDDLQIGPFSMGSVPIGVMPDGALGVSLLGMSTLDRFAGWRIEGDRLILSP
jgi:aspartyl protease family protein